MSQCLVCRISSPNRRPIRILPFLVPGVSAQWPTTAPPRRDPSSREFGTFAEPPGRSTPLLRATTRRQHRPRIETAHGLRGFGIGLIRRNCSEPETPKARTWKRRWRLMHSISGLFNSYRQKQPKKAALLLFSGGRSLACVEKTWARLSQADQNEYFCDVGAYLRENSCWSMLSRLLECYCTGGTKLRSLKAAAGFLDALAWDQFTHGGKPTGRGAVPVNLRKRRRRKANKLITFIRILIRGNRYGGSDVIKQASLYTIIMNGSIENLQGFYREIKESDLGFHRNTMLHLIDRLSDIPTWKEALSILEDLTPEDGKRLILTRAWAVFQTMFYQATYIGQEECNAVIKKMLECGITPTTETYNIIMSRAVREGNGDNLRLAFREMMATNLTPTMVTYGVLHKFYKESRKEEERQMVIRDALILDRRLNVILATDILHSKVLSKAPYLEVHEEFCKFFHPGPLGQLELTTRGYVGGKLHPDHVTVAIMVYAFCREDRGSRRVWKTYQRYLAIVQGRENMHDRATLLNAGSFIPNAFMLAFGRHGDLNYCALVLEDMMRPESLIRPGVVSWSILLHALGKKGKMDQVERVLAIMTLRGFRPNAVTWTSLLSAYIRHNQPYKAGEVVSRMRMAEVQPSQVTLDTLRKYLDSQEFIAGVRGEAGPWKQ